MFLLTHLTFLHGGTIGTYATAENAEVSTRATDHDVTVTRWITDSPAPATYIKARGFTSNIDRWQFINFTPPCYVRHSPAPPRIIATERSPMSNS